MALDATSTILPGRGAVFVGEVDAVEFDLDGLDLNDPATFATWISAGHTSRENLPAFAKDGGEATQKGSWEEEAIRSNYSSTAWSLAINALQLDKATLELAFGGGTYDAAKKRYSVKTISEIKKSIFLVMFDGDVRAGIYMPNTTITLGDAPEIDVENFFEVQLSAQLLNSPTTGERFGIWEPRPYVAPTP